MQVSQEAAEVATKVKGSWGSGIAEEHIAWVPIVSGMREYAEASFPPLVENKLSQRDVTRRNEMYTRCITGKDQICSKCAGHN